MLGIPSTSQKAWPCQGCNGHPLKTRFEAGLREFWMDRGHPRVARWLPISLEMATRARAHGCLCFELFSVRRGTVTATSKGASGVSTLFLAQDQRPKLHQASELPEHTRSQVSVAGSCVENFRALYAAKLCLSLLSKTTQYARFPHDHSLRSLSCSREVPCAKRTVAPFSHGQGSRASECPTPSGLRP